MLKVSKIEIAYKKAPVVRDVSFEVLEGEVVAIVGSNGAGKSTLLRSIAGLKEISEGEIKFLDEKIANTPAHKVAQKGLCLIPEGARVFSKLTIEDNLMLGTFAKTPGYKMAELSQNVYEMFPVLKNRKHLNAETLSGGERQMLAIGRAMMSQPKLLMMDEPTAGLSPILAEEVFVFIKKLREMGLTILLVEQQVEHALETADRAYVLENGEILMEGLARDVVSSDIVRKAYLGL
jgi:branched-chain amino acid transport system ATP-binding protein